MRTTARSGNLGTTAVKCVVGIFIELAYMSVSVHASPRRRPNRNKISWLVVLPFFEQFTAVSLVVLHTSLLRSIVLLATGKQVAKLLAHTAVVHT